MKTVVVINGRPRAGKDSTVLLMQQALCDVEIQNHAFSSIDPVRDMLTRAGFDLNAKTPEDRALLAEVGDSVEKHSQWRTRQCLWEAAKFFGEDDKPRVLFLHVREPRLIQRIKERIEDHGWRFVTILVKSVREENVTSNAADIGVEGMHYDGVIHNDGTLDDLAQSCDKILFELGVIEQLSFLHRRSIQHIVD